MTEDIKKIFRGTRAVYGEQGFDALQHAHVMVIGLGGVGSWMCEALCRTAVGALTIVDADNIEITNANRQSHTTLRTCGHSKTEVMAEHLLSINPKLKLKQIHERLSSQNIEAVLADCPPYVGEAIDDISAKAFIANFLYRRGSTFIIAGGAGGRTDPRRLATGDLACARGDALIARLRNILRKDYGFPKGGEKMKIYCTYSSEKPVYSSKEAYISGDLPAFGAAMTVTASAGLLMAAWLISKITGAGAPGSSANQAGSGH